MERRLKVISDHPNYSIGDDGTLYSRNGKPKAQHIGRDGYKKSVLYDNGKGKTERIARLVAEAFVPNPDNKPDVNHIDGNKLNNCYDNLEWVTKSENMKHAYQTGLATPHPTYGMRGHKNPNAGSKGKPVRILETGDVYDNVAKCARAIGANERRIHDCLYGKQNSHMGYHFERI